MKNITLISLGISILFLQACINDAENSNSSFEGNELSIWKDFSIKSSTEFEGKIVRDDSSIALTTYKIGDEKTKSDMAVHIYYNIPVLSSTPCSPSITGVSNISTIKEISNKWGRVDYYDSWATNPAPEPLCKPPVITGGDPHLPNEPSPYGAYAFCSENNGKKVLICVSQMTDNAEQAKEIFETFRWTP